MIMTAATTPYTTQNFSGLDQTILRLLLNIDYLCSCSMIANRHPNRVWFIFYPRFRGRAGRTFRAFRTFRTRFGFRTGLRLWTGRTLCNWLYGGRRCRFPNRGWSRCGCRHPCRYPRHDRRSDAHGT